MTIKKIALVVDMKYVSTVDEYAKWEAIKKYEKRSEIKIDRFKDGATGRIPLKKDQDRVRMKHVIDQCRGNEIQRLYVCLPSPFEPDKYRESAYPLPHEKSVTKVYRKKKGYTEIEYFYNPIKNENSPNERLKKEIKHYSEYADAPEKFGNVDKTLHWIVSNAGSNVDIVHIDTSVENPIAYSVSEEYFAEKPHRPYDQEEADWAIAFGLSREVTAELLKILPDEHDRYVYANGGSEPGSTPDAQVVPCPKCGRPTWAAPASVGSKDNYEGIYKPKRVDAKQMLCEHCGEDLSSVFSK